MDKLLTTQEVADLTRVTVHTVRFWRKNGTGPQGFRLGKRVVYRERDVQTWVQQHRRAELCRGAA
ncbi:helix-turn-helix transcriptional regulator [Knoellia koreensis]|uniref:Helix-turn-helix domain-containing protein n=1 Tax=Knoellia koreensis TaxID=2730921 RepID=A0A849HD40_9MICO|nr:helix-turn-helix domain-containing protein [Knoellia sp. DB2414S]NNM44584.1 helix-turn-helix domain-containing protein [Knoellia sp. DB2414S]